MGSIIAVCRSSQGGIPKYSQVVVRVGERGFEDDFHNRLERWSFGRKIWVPNVDRHLLLVEEEVKRSISQTKKITGGIGAFLASGSLSENILTHGLDLSRLTGGQMLAIRNGDVLLRVVEPAKPCKHVRAAYGIEVYVALMERRGMYCAVHKGVGQTIQPSDSIEVIGGGEGVASGPPPNDKPSDEKAKLEFEKV